MPAKKSPALRHAFEGVTCAVSQVSKEFAKPGCQVRWPDPALALQTPIPLFIFHPFNQPQLQKEEISDSVTFHLVSVARPTETKEGKAKN